MHHEEDMVEETSKRRALGVHLTSQETFKSYILPEIKNILHDHAWIDLYCGEGNLIFPILEKIPDGDKVDFFRDHLFLSDIQSSMVEKCRQKADSYGIPQDLAKKNIFKRDNLEEFPKRLKSARFPLFHVTNPPYLYLGYIRKHEKTKRHFKYFENENEGYQDLYQVAMMNDLRNDLNNLIYIIPSNFLFGFSVSNKFRADFLRRYEITKMLVFETQIFEFTGTNICIGFFKRKNHSSSEPQKFIGLKFKKNDRILKREYDLLPEFNYRAGAEFDEFGKEVRAIHPLSVKYYLLNEEVRKNQGSHEIKVIDTNKYVSNEYAKETLGVNEELGKKVQSNILYVRTVDTGSRDGRAGLYVIKEDFGVDGIYVSKATYRTSPIQLFLTPSLSREDQLLLKDYFNVLLESFRAKLDSEFLTTYKYSDADYTRKYLGLTQVRKLIETFPIRDLDEESKDELKSAINSNQSDEILEVLARLKKRVRNRDLNCMDGWLNENS